MSTRIIGDDIVHRITAEHTCEPGSGGGATYRETLLMDVHGRDTWHWGANVRHCQYCGEKLPRTPEDVDSMGQSGDAKEV